MRPAETKDIPDIIEASLSVNPWKVKHNHPGAETEKITMYQTWIDNKEGSTETLKVFVAEVDGNILGYLLLGRKPPIYFAASDLKQMYLADITVHREYGGQGLGDAMIDWVKQEAKKQGVDVIRAECAKGKLEEWYHKRGFISVPYRGPASNYPNDIHTMIEMPKTVF